MNRGLKIIIAALVVGTEAVIAAAISPAAIATGFRSQVTLSEDCRGGYSNCRQQQAGLGMSCEVSVQVFDKPGSLGSTTDHRGSNTMYMRGGPTIVNGVVTLNGQEYSVNSGKTADVLTFGGSFSAYLGEPSSSSAGARVYFSRVNGRPKAYAAYIYVDGQAYRCGRTRSM